MKPMHGLQIWPIVYN